MSLIKALTIETLLENSFLNFFQGTILKNFDIEATALVVGDDIPNIISYDRRSQPRHATPNL